VKKGKKACLLLFLLFSLLSFPFTISADSRIEIHDIRYHIHPSFTRVVIEIGKVRDYSFNQLSSPDRVYVDIYQVKLNPSLHGQSYLVQCDYLDQVRIAQKNPSTVRAVVDLDFSKAYYKVWYLPDPFRLIIDVYPKKTPELPPPPRLKTSIIRQLGLGIQRVVIDPGHGGKDPGCIGNQHKLQEKKVVLDVCLRLKALLESLGLEVIMTRETDIYLPPETRTVIANQKQADIFISVHANASRNRKLSGVQTFYLNLSQDPTVVETASRENATSTKNIGQMSETIKKILQNTKIPESMELAQTIQKNLVHTLSQKYGEVHDLGVKGGPFWVLIGAEVPSVLVEISFLSNPAEEENLRDPQYLERIALGIYQGIIAYKSSLEKGIDS
jgi:N-acetylmuramoyl-L-alanine amidase